MSDKVVLEFGEPDIGEDTETKTAETKTEEIVESQYLSEENFTEAERNQIAEFAQKIDIKNTTAILQYGAAAQKKIAEFSEVALENVRTKELGEVGDMLTSLVTELKTIDVEKSGFFDKLFKRSSSKITNLKSRYGKIETSVENISDMLEKHQIQLLKDVAVLDQMYDKNLDNFKELSMYILAGKKKLEEVRSTVLPELKAKAEESKLPEDAQVARDMASFCDRFEKKLYDLQLTRMVSIQMAPQIRLVQGNDTTMAEKIQTTLNNTIPLWKSQLLIALGLEHSAQATQAQKEVSDMTNQLLLKNAEKLKLATVETAKESERGIVDLETLQSTNRMLIETLDEVVKIQEDGHAKREAAERELAKLEGEIKQKLLDIKEIKAPEGETVSDQ